MIPLRPGASDCSTCICLGKATGKLRVMPAAGKASRVLRGNSYILALRVASCTGKALLPQTGSHRVRPFGRTEGVSETDTSRDD